MQVNFLTLYTIMTLLQDKKLLIFDCDGVLFDSHNANIAYVNHCLELGGYPPLREELHDSVVYMSTRQFMNNLFSDPAEADRLYRITQETDYTPFIKDLDPLFDFDRVLGKLNDTFYLAVATNRGQSLERLIRHFRLDRYFSLRVSTVEAPPKPHPGMLIKCMDHFGVSAGETLFFGDADSDRITALNAGIDYLWVGGTNMPGIASIEDLLQHIPVS